MKETLESLGYSTMMVFTNTTNEVSKARNLSRAMAGGRVISEDIRNEKWHEAQHNLEIYKTMFRNNFVIIDNNSNTKDIVLESEMRKIQSFTTQPLNDIAKARFIRQKQKRHITEKVFEVGTAAAVDNSAKHVPGQGKLVSIEEIRIKRKHDTIYDL